jgi:hypothetical protein
VTKAFEQMEENFYQDDFEQFLQEHANDHRMFPSDGVWRSIHKQLHGDSRWPALTIAAFTLLVTTVAICVYFSPKPNIFAFEPAAILNRMQQHSNASKSNLALRATMIADKHEKKVMVETVNWKPIDKSVSTVEAQTLASTPEQFSTAENGSPIVSGPVATNASKSNNNFNLAVSPIAQGGNLPTESLTIIVPGDTEANPIISQAGSIQGKVVAATAKPADADDRNVADKYLKENRSDIALHTEKKKPSAVNSLSYTVYITPSISYRNLKEDRSYLKGNASGPVALNYVADVHQIVRHKPGNGLEAGFAMLYSISPSLRLKGGLQFNFRQYSIEAYRSATELASISLIRQKRIDTVNTIAIYRTTNGNSAAEITNRYYQLSVPVGIDWQAIGNKSLQLHLAATLQPTYQLNRNAYILSTNLKNYTESPEMLKRWNMNTSIEAYMSFKVGDYRWQFGPQLRYQTLPTLIPEYPIKEHLMDYGIKLGVTKPLR